MNYETKSWKIIRWIGVLPCAIAFYFAVYLFIYYTSLFYSSSDSWNMQYGVPIYGSFMAGGAFVLYGAKIAPSHNKKVALVLLSLCLLLTGASVIINIMYKEYFRMFTIISSLAGSCLGYAGTENEEKIE